jgi:predicted transcriptional regulator
MKTRFQDDTAFRVVLDDQTVARLIEVAEACHADPATIIASLVHDVLEDDALAHLPDAHEKLH